MRFYCVCNTFSFIVLQTNCLNISQSVNNERISGLLVTVLIGQYHLQAPFLTLTYELTPLKN
jgi:hypothetical protein